MMRVLQRVLVLVLVIPAFTTGCKDSSPLEGTPQDTLSRILERGEMRVGFLVWGPCIMQDAQTRELSGIYVDMVVQIARALNVEISWQETTLAAFAADLQTRRFDFSVGPTFMTIPRAAAVSFTQPVAYSGNSGVVRTNSPFRPPDNCRSERRRPEDRSPPGAGGRRILPAESARCGSPGALRRRSDSAFGCCFFRPGGYWSHEFSNGFRVFQAAPRGYRGADGCPADRDAPACLGRQARRHFSPQRIDRLLAINGSPCRLSEVIRIPLAL